MSDYTEVLKTYLHRLPDLDAYLPFNNPTLGNPPFGDASCRVLIVRLSPFRDVDRSLPHLFLVQEVRRALPHAFIDLAFFPGRGTRELFDELDVPYLLGTQSMRSAQSFDLVLISNAYTLELINLPYLWLHAGLPLYASQRGPEWPIVILGGSNAMAAQAIVGADGDSLVDGIFVGEGEGRVSELVRLLAQGGAPQSRSHKQQALAEVAAQLDGLWVAGPSLESHETVKAVYSGDDASCLSIDVPLLNSPEVHTASIQIDYGCPAFCSFCFEGYDRKPYRQLSLPDLLAAARRIKRVQGA